MDTLNKLIDQARATCERDSDRALALRLKVTAQSLFAWRKGGKIKDEYLAALIEMAKADPSLALKIRAEQASSKAEIRLWNHMLTRLASAALLGVMYIM